MEKIKERKKQTWDNMFYSAQRFDLLIVSFSGAGIYVCLEAIKYFADKTNIQYPSLLLKVCGLVFVVAIILNFLSQRYGYKANEQDYLMCEAELELNSTNVDKNKKVKLLNEIDKYDKKAEKLSKITKNLNFYSMLTLFVGMSLIVLFFFIAF